jgi:polygalacturonase
MKKYLLYILIQIMASGAMMEAATLPILPSASFLITNYGAASSKSVNNTAAIQKTIDACSTAGGGTVVIPAGIFVSGPLLMKSNINLQISEGATLRVLPYGENRASSSFFPKNKPGEKSVNFIYGKDLTNIEVTGKGTIDGQGSDWWSAFHENKNISRPCLIRFDACTNIAILGITLLNAPNVHLTIGRGSSNTTIANITILAPSNAPNTDGIDTWSANIDITRCNISCGDDNIAMDSGSENIRVTNCIFGTGHGCSIGSYTVGIQNIVVDSCVFRGTTAGIRLKTGRGRGGVEQNISYSNITMTDVKNPIAITSYYPKTPASPADDQAQDVTTTTPSWQHIVIRNVVAVGSANAGVLWGLPERSISDVVLDNVKISAETGMTANFVTGLVFKNGSSIKTSRGDAIKTYQADVTGINLVTGK